MKKRLINYFFCFLLLLSLSEYCVSSDASELEETMSGAFRGTHPFYAIMVARDTITAAYVPLASEEKDIVFSILTALLSGEAGEFASLARRFIEEQQRWFLQRRGCLEKTASGFDAARMAADIIDKKVAPLDRVKDFKGFLVSGVEVDFKATLRGFVTDIITHRRAGEAEAFKMLLREAFGVDPSKPSNLIFEGKSREIFDFISNFEGILEKRKKDTAVTEVFETTAESTLFGEYTSKIGEKDPSEFFRSVFINAERICGLSQRIYGEKILRNPCLVIFNEMFFSKDIPLSSEEFSATARNLRELTQHHPNVLVHANFLYEIARPFGEEGEYRTFLDGQARAVDFLSTRTHKQIFESGRHEDYRRYVEQFRVWKSHLNILRNQSFVFWNGNPVTNYMKSSYMREADTQLAAGKFYELGLGRDEISDAFMVGSPEERVARILMENLSTEICYDLEIGVRKKLDSYPRAGKIHVVVSNTLPLAQQRRAENLPDHIPLIIHVDPQDQEILLRTESRAILLPDTLPAVSGDPLHAIRINQFTKAMPLSTFRVNLTNNNVFIFHVWDLQHYLQTALFNRDERQLFSEDQKTF